MWLKLLRIAGLVGLVVLGYLLALVFQFTVNFHYQNVYQTHDSAAQRTIELSVQPRYPTQDFDLFGTSKDNK